MTNKFLLYFEYKCSGLSLYNQCFHYKGRIFLIEQVSMIAQTNIVTDILVIHIDIAMFQLLIRYINRA